MAVRKVVVGILLAVLAAGGVLLAVLFAALHSPIVLSRLASAFGYELQAGSVALSPSLTGTLSDVTLTQRGDGGLTLAAARVTTRNSVRGVLRGEIDTLVLENPRFTFRGGKQASGGTDLSFLGRVSAIRLLELRNATVTIDGPTRVDLTDLHLAVKNYSASAGGNASVRTRFSVTDGEKGVAASGELHGNVQLTAGYPRPYGTGTLDLALEAGSYTSGGARTSLAGLRLSGDLADDRRTETLALTRLEGASPQLGSIRGSGKGVLRGDFPWSASLSLGAVDLARALTVLTPLLPEEYQGWALRGDGSVEAAVQGTYADGRPSFDGTVTFVFLRGGFSSADGTKAAEGMSGRLVLKLQYVPPGRKVALRLESEQADGEVLWGSYYRNLGGQRAALVADGALLLDAPRRFELSGTLDVFQTGRYAFSAEGSAAQWSARLDADEVSHAKLVDALLKDSLTDRLAGLSVSGTSSLRALARRDGAHVTITGRYRLADTTLLAPAASLAIHGLAVDLPFALVYPVAVQTAADAPTAGLLRVSEARQGSVGVTGLRVPLRLARNRLEVPEAVAVPLFGGTVSLSGLEIDDVLFPRRYRVGVQVTGLDLGRLTGALFGVELAGTLNADLGTIRYENGRLASEGHAIAAVLGGQVEARSLFAEHLASPARRLGADITFRGIRLDEVTRTISIGKMSGVVQGALEHLVIEYGEPARFVLTLESVKTDGVEQWISVEAIQSISVLGTGASSPLNRGITQFFREYPYSQIGIRCVLNNDQFAVNGTIHAGGKEYLVRRGFLRGVDVVNQNPNNMISFRDMRERLARLTQPQPPDVRIQ